MQQIGIMIQRYKITTYSQVSLSLGPLHHDMTYVTTTTAT